MGTPRLAKTKPARLKTSSSCDGHRVSFFLSRTIRWEEVMAGADFRVSPLDDWAGTYVKEWLIRGGH